MHNVNNVTLILESTEKRWQLQLWTKLVKKIANFGRIFQSNLRNTPPLLPTPPRSMLL